MEEYPSIRFPYDKSFEKLSKKEAEETFEWFLKIVPIRVGILVNAIRSSKPYWRADFERASLFSLGEWMKGNMVWVDFNDDAKDKFIKENNLKGMNAQLVRERNINLPPSSLAMRFDAAVYLGETMRKNVKHLKWDFGRNKRLWTYNEPILVLTKNHPKNYIPVPILKTAGTSSTRASLLKKTDSFVQAFDFWKERLTVGYTPPEVV